MNLCSGQTLNGRPTKEPAPNGSSFILWQAESRIGLLRRLFGLLSQPPYSPLLQRGLQSMNGFKPFNGAV
jgi:hypothetical protein